MCVCVCVCVSVISDTIRVIDFDYVDSLIDVLASLHFTFYDGQEKPSDNVVIYCNFAN